MSHKIMNRVTMAALSLGIALSSAYAAPPAEMILNGGFETGTFAGWTVVNTGSGAWTINNGTFDPVGPGTALAPISGGFDAVSNQPGPGFHALRQTVSIPSGVFSAKLSWNDRVRNWATIFSDPNQEWRVVIRDTGGAILHEVHSTTPGDALQQVGPNARSGDLTAFFQANAGQTVVVSFEEQDNLLYFNATLDDVQLLVSVLPTTKDECKDDGWKTFLNVNTGQQIFKNQGDCVSFVATKGKNPPAYN